MIILSKKCVGLIQECPTCGAVLAYDTKDVYENKYVYCPICKTKILTSLDLSYNGVIKEKQ